MEETLALQSERDFLKAVEENSQFLLTTFTLRHRRFDGERRFVVVCVGFPEASECIRGGGGGPVRGKESQLIEAHLGSPAASQMVGCLSLKNGRKRQHMLRV